MQELLYLEIVSLDYNIKLCATMLSIFTDWMPSYIQSSIIMTVADGIFDRIRHGMHIQSNISLLSCTLETDHKISLSYQSYV